MSEILTTGQMIDVLGKDEVAENSTGDKMYWKDDELTIESSNGHKYNFLPFGAKGLEWKIAPEYVTFSEAMKAVKEHKRVYFHPKNSPKIKAPFMGKNLLGTGLERYNLTSLYDGKWTIES